VTVAITNCETMGTLAPGRVVPRSAAPKPPRLDLEADLGTEAVKAMALDLGAGAVKRRADDNNPCCQCSDAQAIFRLPVADP
jgi:hypothetical protein